MNALKIRVTASAIQCDQTVGAERTVVRMSTIVHEGLVEEENLIDSEGRRSATVERYLQPLLQVEDGASGPRSYVRQQDLVVESPPGNRAPDEPCRDEGKAGELGAVATWWQHCKINCNR